MPRQTEKEQWVQNFRDLLKESYGYTEGWYVFNSRGKIRLQLLLEDQKPQSRILPFAWEKKSISSALPYIQQIFKRYHEGTGRMTLAKACEVTAASDSKQSIQWKELVEEYKSFIPNANETTWKKSYYRDPDDKNMRLGKIKAPPVLNRAGDLMVSKKKPIDGTDLMMKSIKYWEQGGRGRQIARRVLKGFLEWAVMRGKLPSAYAPPAHTPEIRNPKRVGYPLSDSQILRLLDGLPDERWRFAVQLCSVFGLRPEELRHLKIKEGPNGKELWTIYQKSKGGKRGDKTEPRKLHPLLVRDEKGNPIDWKLQQRIEIGETIPSLGGEKDGKGGEALRTYLRRRAVWKSLQKEAENVGEILVPYTFRHRYAKESHAAGFPIANISQAMGHSVKVHLESYARFAPDATTDLYAKRNKTVKVA